MHNNTIAYLGMAALWLLVTPCQAKNTLSGRPSEQQQNLPALTPEADKKPFVLPSVEQLPSHSVKATELPSNASSTPATAFLKKQTCNASPCPSYTTP
jgi:hypothetical protein